MTSLTDVFVTVQPETDHFDRDLRRKLSKVNPQDSGKKVATRFGVGMNGAIGGVVSKSAGIFAAGFAAIKVGGFLKDAIGDASDLGETMSKSASVFGKANKEITAFGRTSADSIGQSKAEATAAASQFGNMFNQLGIGQKPAADMSIQMVKLASDFASFHNADITEVLEAQQAAFRGEFDSVQKFVPTINAAAVEQEAMRLKLAGSTKELTQQDKAVATHSLLIKGAGKAQGDFARTSGGMANQQRILSASFADFKANLGTALLPVVTKFFTFLNDRGVPVLKEIAGGFNAFSAAFKANDGDITSSGFPGFMEKVGFAARQAFDYFKANVLPRLREFAEYIRSTVIPIIGDFISTRLASLKKIFGQVRQAIADNRPQLEQLGNAIKNVAKFIIEQLIPFLSKVSGTTMPILGAAISRGIRTVAGLVTAFNAIKEPIRAALRFVTNTFLGVVGTILDGAAKAFGWVPNLGGKLSNAAADFRKFRDDVNTALDGVDDERISITPFINTKALTAAKVNAGRMAIGGKVSGPGGPTDDRAGLYALSDQEWVIQARSSMKYGDRAMRAVNAGRAVIIPDGGFAAGGRPGLNVSTHFPNTGLFAREVAAHAAAVAKPFAQAIVNKLMGPGGPPGSVRSFRGERLNERTIRMLLSAERMLDATFRIMQGSYSTRVAASGGTHSGGGAMDTDGPRGWSTAVSALRRAGFAAWHRTPAQGPWGHHIHSIAIGDPTASASAKRQVQSFLRGGNGLAGMALGGRILPFGSFDSGGFLPPGLSLAHNGTGRPEPVGAGVSVQFTNCTFAGTSKAQFEDLIVSAVDRAKAKRRI